MTQPSAGAPQVVRSEFLDTRMLGCGFDDVPNRLRGETFSPHGIALIDTTKDDAFRDGQVSIFIC
jgi:hypothetical protein